MKRLLALILAAALALSLVACGGGGAGDTNTSNDAPSTENEETTSGEPQDSPDTPPEETGPVKLYMNETATIGAFELTITDTTFVESYKSSTMLHYPNSAGGNSNGGDIFLRVDYTIKNIGKTAQYSPNSTDSFMQVNYNDGFMFSYYRSYISGTEHDEGVENSREMKPLSDAQYGRIYFSLPSEVHEATNNSLNLEISLSDESGEKASAVFEFRPMDEHQQEAYYNFGTQLMENADSYQDYYYAYLRFEDLGNYKDSAEKYEDALYNYHTLRGFIPEDYFREHQDRFSVLTDAEISEAIIGSWDVQNNPSMTFNEDGTIDEANNRGWTWKVEGDKISISNGYSYEVRRVTDDMLIWLAVNDDGNVYIARTLQRQG